MQEHIEKKYLVIDYDGCAHSNYDVQRNDWLSPQLIEHAQKGRYSGFYGCSHRSYYGQTCYISIFQYVFTAPFMENDLTYKITQNFEIATKLKCMAVSTQDDVFYTHCGDAFEKIIKPYEENRQLPSSEMKYNSPWGLWSNHSSKNRQLIQIAQHVKNYHSKERPITLDYIDDRQDLCEEAEKVTVNENWPKNVKLNVYHHYANDTITLFNQSKKQEITEPLELTQGLNY